MDFKKPTGLTAESIFFYTCLVATVAVLVFCGSFPTLDGPSHIYNAKITDYLLSGNKFISTYYSLSAKPSPNYSDHYLLAFFCGFLPFAAAGKLMEIVYIVSFAILFRRLVLRFNPGNGGLSVLSIPFAFNILFFMGFFNFCLSFSLLFVVILYYHKWFYSKLQSAPISKYVILMLLVVLLYFTNGLAFLFAGLILGMFELHTLLPVITKQVIPTEKYFVLKRILLFCTVWVPGIIMFLVFVSQTPSYTTGETHTFSELLSWLKNVRIMEVYTDYETDYTQWLFYILMIALIASFVVMIRTKSFFKLNAQSIFFAGFVCALIMYFTVPDGMSVGMMSIRFCAYSFIFFSLWLAMLPGCKVVTWILAIAAISIHFALFINVRIPAESEMEIKSEVVKAASDFIEPNSVVLDVNLTGDWLCGHIGDYLSATNKPLVIVPNYEADDSWFATAWNNNMPQLVYNRQDSVAKYCNLPGADDAPLIKEIDYVFVYGNYDKILNEAKWSGVKEGILNRYKLSYMSDDSIVSVFELKVKSTSPEPAHLLNQSTTQGQASPSQPQY